MKTKPQAWEGAKIMNSNRRQMLAGAAALAVAWPLRGLAADPGLRRTVDALAQALLDQAPQQVSYLGLDKGPRAAARSRLDDRSPQASARIAAIAAEYRRRLDAIDPAALGSQDRILRQSVITALGLGIGGRPFRFGANGFDDAMSGNPRPYVITQSNAAALETPEFLDTKHRIEDSADAEAYLSRLAQLPQVMDQETERLRADHAAGVVAPAFILDKAIGQLTGLRGAAAARQKLVRSLADRARAKDIGGDWEGRATGIVETAVRPALDRQLAALAKARADAGQTAGVWRLKDGGAYYAWLLGVGTTTRLTAEELHRIGLEQNRELEARMDAILRGQGLTQGSVAARTQALSADPRYVYADSDAGRAALLDYLNRLIAETRPRLGRISKLTLKAEVTIRRVPPDIQDGAAQGYMNPGSLDGSRPAIYYINLKSMGNWPRWQLPTLTAHETVPGHAWQLAYLADHRDEVPLISSIMGFNGFIEGWALYAEQLNDELGAYDDDPLARLGYLQGQRFRAGRLVVDTGIHAKRWTRAQAIDWLIDNTGRARDGVTSEIDRYCVWPGQACGYKAGHNELIRLRAKARAALGAGFDLRDYNDAVVATGGVPLTVLESAVDAYVARTKAA